MKKLSILALTLAMVLAHAAPVLAEEGTNQETKSSVRADFEAKRAEVQKKIKENEMRLKESREDLRKDLKEVNKDVRKEVKDDVREVKREGKDDRSLINGARVRVAVALRVFEATIARLETLSLRIESRIGKLSTTTSASTTDATNFVNAAKQNLVDAKAHVAILKSIQVSIGGDATSLASTTASSSVREAFAKIKEEAKLVREALTKAKQNLMRAIGAIKKIEKPVRSQD